MPRALANTLAELKRTMQSATDLGVPWDRFHDEFATVPAFTGQGDQADNERIELALAAVAKFVLGEPHPVRDACFVRLPEHHFWHGSCQIGPRAVIFFYYDDVNVGLAGLFRDFTDPRVELARMSLLDPSPGSYPGRRPAKGTVH